MSHHSPSSCQWNKLLVNLKDRDRKNSVPSLLGCSSCFLVGLVERSQYLLNTINYIIATKCYLLKKCYFWKDHPNSTGSGISWKFYQPNQPKMVNTDRTWLLSSTKQDCFQKSHDVFEIHVISIVSFIRVSYTVPSSALSLADYMAFNWEPLIAGSLLILLQHEVLVTIHGQQGRPCLSSLL